MKELYFDDVCYDIYLENDIIYSLDKYSFYDKANELLTKEQYILFEQGERQFENLKL